MAMTSSCVNIGPYVRFMKIYDIYQNTQTNIMICIERRCTLDHGDTRTKFDRT